MEASKISRLREEQEKAVTETEDKIGQLKRYKEDYEQLQNRLETLTDRVTHNVMVPLGKLAFMPGQLVHTNEILVLLGDNWFAEQSSKQARAIVDRRLKELDEKLTEFKGQKKLLEPRLGITSELQVVAEGKGDYKEIIEDYSEEKEKLWDKQHKINVRHHHEKLRMARISSRDRKQGEEEANSGGTPLVPIKSDEDLWSCLDALEKQEEERGEFNSSFESDNNIEEENTLIEESHYQKQRNMSSTMNMSLNLIDMEDKNDEDFHEDHNYCDTDSNGDDKPIVKTITFRHTKAPTLLSHKENPECNAPYDVACSIITSPAEIYKLFSPKPILKEIPKSMTSGSTVRFPDADKKRECSFLPNCEQTIDLKAKSCSTKPVGMLKDKAFSGVVVENPNAPAPFSPNTKTKKTPVAQEQLKQISKFRARRMEQNLSG